MKYLKGKLPLFGLFVLIIFVAAFLRFTNYDNRWTLSQDQARDAIIGQYTARSGNIPIVGPPSSVGEFSFSPIYYWIISGVSYLFPNSLNVPWFLFTLFSIGTVILITLTGYLIGGKKLALPLGLISAVSSAQIFHSVDLLNPMLVPFFTAFSFLCLSLVIEKKRIFISFLLGLSVGLAIGFHFQALGLLFLIVFAPFFVEKSKRLATIILTLLGLLLSFIPFIYLNIQTQGQFIYNLAKYYIGGSSDGISISIAIKDLIITWPRLWGEVINFYPETGYLLLPLVFLIAAVKFIKFGIESKILQAIILVFILQIVMLFFYPGARMPVYMLVFHPFILLITGWAGLILWNYKRLLGMIFFGFISLSSIYSNINIIKGYTQKLLIENIKGSIDDKSQGYIDLYSFESSEMVGLPLYYLYLKEGRISQNGLIIAVCEYKLIQGVPNCPTAKLVPFLVRGNYYIYDLNEKPDDEIRNIHNLEKVSSEKVYADLYDYYR